MDRAAVKLLVVLALAGALGASAQGLASPQRALLLLRVLVYDRHLKARAHQEVRVAVVFRQGHAASEKERGDLVRGIGEVADRAVVAGLPVRVTEVPYLGAADFQARLTDSGAVAMYLCDGLEPAMHELNGVAKDRSVLTVCGSRTLVSKGCAIALVDRGDRAALVVNQDTAAGQGADLDPRLLSIAERVKAGE